MKSKGMATTKFNECRMVVRLLLTTAWCLFCGLPLSSAATKTVAGNSQATTQGSTTPVDFTRLQFSAGLLDIVRMVKANVDPEVIKTFINHSRISYHPSAQEVIALKKLGVSDDIIVTMIGHRLRPPDSTQAPVRQMMRTPAPEEMPTSPAPLFGGGYPFHPYPMHPFPMYGSVTSFNNSFPTYVNGYPAYSGYYLQTYPLFW
jgi:hypothetical protein